LLQIPCAGRATLTWADADALDNRSGALNLVNGADKGAPEIPSLSLEFEHNDPLPKGNSCAPRGRPRGPILDSAAST
jgi:hypothetical protein